MAVKVKIDFNEPIIGKDQVLEIDVDDLDDFYVATSDIDRCNICFVLLASLHP